MKDMEYRVSAILVAWMAIGLFTAGCSGSGGGSGGGGGGGEGAILSGTAAAGSPLIGIVTARDAAENTASALIDPDGSFSLDVSALQPPYLLRVQGLAGATYYEILSAATAADVGGTVNVTPLTDLIVANVAGTNGLAFYANPEFGVLTESLLDGQEALLNDRLADLLSAAGVAPGFDLLSSPFDADHTGFDAVLDILEITVDTGTDIATIRNLIDGEEMSDDLADLFDDDPLAVPDPGLIATSIAGLGALAAHVEAFTALFAGGSTPTEAQVTPFLTDDVLISGFDRAWLIDFFTDDAPLTVEERADFIGSLQTASLQALYVSSSPSPGDPSTAVREAPGHPIQYVDDGGGWQMHGDQRSWWSKVDPLHGRTRSLTSPTSAWTVLSLEAEIEGASQDEYVVVTGPLLHPDGYVLRQFLWNDPDNAPTPGILHGSIALSDPDIDAIPNGALYTMTRWLDVNGDTTFLGHQVSGNDGDDVELETYTEKLAIRPIKSTDDVAYPLLTSPTAQQLLAFTSGNLPVAWTLPLGAKSDQVELRRHYSTGVTEIDASEWVLNDDISVTLTGVPPPSEPLLLEFQNLSISVRDVLGRSIVDNVATF